MFGFAQLNFVMSDHYCPWGFSTAKYKNMPGIKKTNIVAVETDCFFKIILLKRKVYNKLVHLKFPSLDVIFQKRPNKLRLAVLFDSYTILEWENISLRCKLPTSTRNTVL